MACSVGTHQQSSTAHQKQLLLRCWCAAIQCCFGKGTSAHIGSEPFGCRNAYAQQAAAHCSAPANFQLCLRLPGIFWLEWYFLQFWGHLGAALCQAEQNQEAATGAEEVAVRCNIECPTGSCSWYPLADSLAKLVLTAYPAPRGVTS